MNKQLYFKAFSDTPINSGEPRLQYYERISKVIGKSPRTIEEYFPIFLKMIELGKIKGRVFIDTDDKTTVELTNYPEVKVNFHQVYPIKPQPKTTLTTTLTGNYEYIYPINKPKSNINIDQGLHLVLPDVHVPFENIELLTNLLRFMEDYSNKIKSFTILGDFLDMLALSKHELNQVPMKGYSLGLEYEQGNSWLDLFDDTLQPNCKKNFIFGNHEDRYKRHFNDINNSVFADVTPNPTVGLKLKERGYNVLENWKEDYVALGKLQIIHGFYLGVNPCRQHLTRMKCSSMFGHSHRISSYFEGDQASFNIGCLCDISSPGFNYASRYEKMNWQNGFALVNIDEVGNFQVEQITCINNKFSYAGKSYGK